MSLLNFDKLANELAELSGHKRQALITQDVFQTQLFAHKLCSDYLWKFYTRNNKDSSYITSISEDAFVRSSEAIFGVITDKDQVTFYLKVFSSGKEMMSKSSFMDFLRTAFDMHIALDRPGSSKKDDESSVEDSPTALPWLEAVSKSAYHIKTEMSVCFLTNWILTNVPRLLNGMHKVISNQLLTSYAKLKSGNKTKSQSPVEEISPNDTTKTQSPGSSENGTSHDPNRSLIHPALMWLLRSSLPGKYFNILDKKPDPSAPSSPQQLINMLAGGGADQHHPLGESWSLLYDSDDQGLSINRFQHHVFNYRGPTLMFVKAENDYLFCIATDIEWRESCHFWGGADSLLMMVKPEFRIVERGAKLLYVNFSIRGYPFGIQVGRDTRNLSLEIKPEFNYVSYKQIPYKLMRFLAWGCAPPEVKVSQSDLRKWEAKQAEKNRKINLNNPEWKENPDKYLLELAGNYKSYDHQ